MPECLDAEEEVGNEVVVNVAGIGVGPGGSLKRSWQIKRKGRRG